MPVEPTVLQLILLGLSAFAAGAVNSVAGGGTLITFSTLIAVGLDPKIANATSTVALWPGSLGGAIPHHKELRNSWKQLLLFGIPSLIGGGIGSWLVLYTTSGMFQKLVPGLILFATVLFAVRGRFKSPADSPSSPLKTVGVIVFQMLVGVYGGFFGAGIGILMLAALSFLGERDLNRANGIKNILAMCINGVAVVVFIAAQLVYWKAGLLMTVCSIVGGYQGGTLSRRLGTAATQNIVLAIGILMAIFTFYKYYLH